MSASSYKHKEYRNATSKNQNHCRKRHIGFCDGIPGGRRYQKHQHSTLYPDQLVANAAQINNKGIQVDGLIQEGSPKWDPQEFELTFAIRDRQGDSTVNVIYSKLKPDNFKEGGNVFVEGKYNADRNLITASKLTTKCASKYEAAESAGETADY